MKDEVLRMCKKYLPSELKNYIEVDDDGFINAIRLSDYVREQYVREGKAPFNLNQWLLGERVVQDMKILARLNGGKPVFKKGRRGPKGYGRFHFVMAYYFIEQKAPDLLIKRYFKIFK